MPPRGLTLDGANYSVLVRVSLIDARFVGARTGQRRSFPQNIHIVSN
jgi:hypothetical protein